MTESNLETEIREGCLAIEKTINRASEIQEIAGQINDAETIYFVGCGSSYWTGVISSCLLRENGYDARAVTSSEFCFTLFPITSETAVIGLSQSGETPETIHAVSQAIQQGAKSVAITNTAKSSLISVADYSFVTPAGTQRSMLATKSVDSAVTATYVLADQLSKADDSRLQQLPQTTCEMLNADLSDATSALVDVKTVYTLGVGTTYGLAGEAATKLGEGPLIHTTPLPAFEILHGPIVNATDSVALLIATHPQGKHFYEDLLQDLDEAGARTVVLQPANEDYDADVSLTLPERSATILPALKVIQQIAHDVTLERGFDPDRSLALSKYVDWSNLPPS